MAGRDDETQKTEDKRDQSKKEASNRYRHIKKYVEDMMPLLAIDTSAALSLFFSFCLVVASFLTVLAICTQALIYNYQLKEMQKSTDAATKAANAAEDSVRQSEREQSGSINALGWQKMEHPGKQNWGNRTK